MPTVTKSPSFFRGLGRAQNHQAVQKQFHPKKPPDFLRRLETPVAPLRGDLDLHRGSLSSDLDQRGQGHQLSWAAAKAAGHGHFLFHLLRHLVPGLAEGVRLMVFFFMFLVNGWEGKGVCW